MLDDTLRASSPLAFDQLLDPLAERGVDVPTLRHLLRTGMTDGTIGAMVTMGHHDPGPWYTIGDGTPADPWCDIAGHPRLNHRIGYPFESVWSNSTTPYRRRHLRLVERDGPFCGLCSRQFPAYYSPEHDHRHPRSLGGRGDLDNYQLAHKVCNMVKGANADWTLPASDEVTVWFDPVTGSWREVLSRGVYG